MKQTINRLAGLDIIRCFAIFSVIAGHFFVLNTPFRETIFDASGMFVQGLVYLLFCSTGVPLFIMMTGYLNAHKVECNRKYYKGMGRVLISYLLFSIITILFRKYGLNEEFSLRHAIGTILRFNAIPYGWYIEMWIGLYLLTPFLNLLYQAIPTQKQKLVLLVTLYILTALPDLLNRYGLHLVPGFWQSVFPLTYFFIGRYIREYEPELEGKKIVVAIIAILAICAINPIFTMLFVKGHTMIQIAGGSKGGGGTIVAVLTFILLYKIDIRNVWTKKALTRISLLSLDMYLCCYIFDKIFYPYFIDRYFVDQAQFGIYFFVIVPLVFVASLLTAQVKEWIFLLFSRKNN